MGISQAEIKGFKTMWQDVRAKAARIVFYAAVFLAGFLAGFCVCVEMLD